MFIVEVVSSAERQLNEILDWLESRFGYSVSDEVNDAFREIVVGLATLPYLWPAERIKSGSIVRKAQINKLTLVFYIVDEERRLISIVEIRDARMDWK